MNIDLLRQKTVPLAEETILWFEFLLKPNLLKTHLGKPNPDPSPTDLITQFLSISPDNQIQNELTTQDLNEGLKIGRKQLALKILALKIASFLKWNLDKLEKSLPLQKQLQLLSDLCTVTSGKIVTLPLSLVYECPIGPEGSKHSLTFALTLYHRWVLRALVMKGSQIKTNKTMLPDQANSNYYRDDLFITSLEPFAQTSIDYLNIIVADSAEPFRILTYNCFVALDANVDDYKQKFDSAVTISSAELKSQIYYDLCLYYLYIKKYELARETVILCRDNLQIVKAEYQKNNLSEFVYCNINEDDLNGYLLACGVVFEVKFSLLQRMTESSLNKYKDIIDILKEDNEKKEIPLVQRKLLELDVEGALTITNPKEFTRELHLQIIASNTIRYILDEDINILSNDIFLQKYKSSANQIIEYLIQDVEEMYEKSTLSDKNKLKKYLIDLLLNQSTDFAFIEATLKSSKSKIFSKSELMDLKKQKENDNNINLTGFAAQADWQVCDSKMLRMEIGVLERQLVSCYSANGIRMLLVKLAKATPAKPSWHVNTAWTLPSPIKSIITGFSRSFLQDFTYILIGKSKELIAKNDYASAIGLLNVAKNETQRSDLKTPQLTKLAKLINWEILFIQIIQCLEEWPKSKSLADAPALVINCKQCLGSLFSSDNLYPRVEILEYIAITLLNFNECQSVVIPDKRFAVLELFSVFAASMLDLEKFKGTKKMSREAWDFVVPMFLSNQSLSSNSSSGGSGNASGKRSSARNSNNSDNIASPVQTTFIPFLKKLRDPLIITIVLSLLSKLYNVLKDDTNWELNIDYSYMWPTSISNANAYNIKLVAETLNNFLMQSLQYYPHNVGWLKLKGDLEYVYGQNESAMRYYVTTIITNTEYCTLMHLQRSIIDEYVIRRMIKLCSNLGCCMQSAVLCQFLDDVDYGLAFKNITEKTCNFADAMDSYYSCIWDTTLLEFIINLHSKKGEHKRRLQAISYMGQLELNSNNNDEIYREASSLRKNRFLRTLAKQYMF